MSGEPVEPRVCGVIYDRKKDRPYIDREWGSRENAELALEDLLAPYAPGSEWRKRLDARGIRTDPRRFRLIYRRP